MTHQVSSGSWTRRYAYAEPSQITPAETGNRLSATSLPGDPAPGPYTRHLRPRPPREHDSACRTCPRSPGTNRPPASTTRQVVTSGTPQTTFYVYDAAGQRARKATDRQTPAASDRRAATERIYLGAVELYREFGADGATVTLQRETLHIDAAAQTIARDRDTHPRHRPGARPAHPLPVPNHLGSAVLELDDQAQIITYEEYFPYGGTSYQAVRSQTETPKRYRYTGKERDEETDLSYHGARYYAPWLGRWTSCDPWVWPTVQTSTATSGATRSG